MKNLSYHLPVFFLCLFLVGCKSTKQPVNNVRSIPESELSKLYTNGLKGSYEYMFDNSKKKTQIGEAYYGEYQAGIKGLLLYSNFGNAVSQYLQNEKGVSTSSYSKDFYDIMKFQVFADNIPAFQMGKTTFSPWGIFENGQQGFHRYNPQIIEWGTANLIPAPNTMIGDKTAQQVYNTVFFRFFRIMSKSYQFLEKGDSEKEILAYRAKFSTKDFDALSYLRTRYNSKLDSYGNEGKTASFPQAKQLGFGCGEA